MIKFIGILTILTAIVYTARRIADHPSKPSLIIWCSIAVFTGIILIVHDRAIEISMKGVGSIKAAAQQATLDAKTIADLRKRMEAQSSTVDLVAQQAMRAHTLAAEASSKTALAEQKLQTIDETLKVARAKVEDLDKLAEFTRVAMSAQNDGRRAFDQLAIWAEDPSYPMREEALNAYRTVQDSHSLLIYGTNFIIPWKPGVDPAKFSLEKLKSVYSEVPVWVRPGMIELIWKREDIPKKDRMEFLVEVIRTDQSLTAVEYAGRYLTAALDLKIKPVAIGLLLKAWDEKKDSIKREVPTNPQSQKP